MNTKSLLLIDDETLLLENLKILFKPLFHKVFTANNGLDGLKILKAEKNIHCVISDISMPRISGLDVLEIIRNESNNVPFIFYTALSSELHMKKAAKYKAYDYITKPNFEDLYAVIEQGCREGFTNKDKTNNIDS